MAPLRGLAVVALVSALVPAAALPVHHPTRPHPRTRRSSTRTLMAARRRTINPRPQSTTSTRSTCNREAAGLALVPLALGGGRAGSEIQTPMAIVILCGLTTSTLLNMAVVPTLYLRLGRSRESRLA